MNRTTTIHTPVGSTEIAEREPLTHANFYEFSQDLLSGIRQLHAQHGPIAALQDGMQRVVFLFCSDYNQQVLSDPTTYHARFFGIRGPKRSAQRRLTCGLLTMNGDQHRRNRRLLKEPFGLRAIATYTETIARLTDEMLDTWQPGQRFDIADEMRRLMLRVTSTLLFGFDRPDQAFRIGDMLARWVTMNHQLSIGALVPDDGFTQHYEELLNYAEGLEREIIQMIRDCRAADAPGKDVLSILVRTHDQDGGLTDEELVGQAAVLFGAAHMTTTHSMSWTLFLLSQHPHVMSRLSAEFEAGQRRAVDGHEQAPAGGSAVGQPDSFLDWVIKESMRILPASAYSQRVNMEAVHIGPLLLPRGTLIVFTPVVIHHLSYLYDGPERFDPDRWRTLRPSPYEYLPFGAGPRMCLGGPLAMSILRVSLPRILRRYRLSLVPGAEVHAQIESTMLAPVTGIPMRIHPPDQRFEAARVAGNIHDLVHLPAGS